MDSFMRCISRTARCADLYRSEKLEPLGLGGCQYVYILNICRNPGISQEGLSRKIYINKSNVARQLALLEQSGFVRREADSRDRRVLRVYPTKKAEEALPFVQQVLADWRSYLTGDFSEEERAELDRLLEKLLAKASAYAESRLPCCCKKEGQK